MRKRLAGASRAGASNEEILETLYLTMRAAAAHIRQEAFIALEEVLGEVPSPTADHHQAASCDPNTCDDC